MLAVGESADVEFLNAEAARLLSLPEDAVRNAVGRDCREVLAGQPHLVTLLFQGIDGREGPSRSELVLEGDDPHSRRTIGYTLRVVRDEGGAARGAVMLFRDLNAIERPQSEIVVAESAAMKQAVALAKQVAPIRSTVLISGETGTGKEVIAGLIHAHSPRAQRPFVRVNCAALPETLLEAELFGHERGAFTGADRERIGRFEEASGGSLLLDEIGEISQLTQVKLLRVLQDQEFHRLGGNRVLRTDARIIAATNRDLRLAISRGEFREDLYFRLNVIEIHLPPLRERKEDLQVFTEHYLSRFARELGRPVRALSPAARALVLSHPWAGNVRELRNTIERAVLLAPGSRIEADDLTIEARTGSPGMGGLSFELPPQGIDLRVVEREWVLAALQRTGYVQKEAAELLGVSRRKLNYMIQRMGITHASWRRNRAGDPTGID